MPTITAFPRALNVSFWTTTGKGVDQNNLEIEEKNLKTAIAEVFELITSKIA